jgi:alpha-L-rhamnosidase
MRLLIQFFIPTLLILAGCNSVTEKSTTQPSHLQVEGLKSPLNVHAKNPMLSWYANVEEQVYYQIQVASSEAQLMSGSADLWDSGKVASSQSLNIQYEGKPLDSRTHAVWRVRVWSANSRSPTSWSSVSSWEVGLIH